MFCSLPMHARMETVELSSRANSSGSKIDWPAALPVPSDAQEERLISLVSIALQTEFISIAVG